MKKLLCIALLGIWGLNAQAQEHESHKPVEAIPSAVKGQVYGQNIPESKVTKGKAFEKSLHGENPVKMQVKGTVTDVCSQRGCWITVDIGNGKEVFVKMKDYGFFMPMDSKGKQVLLSGEGFEEVHSVEELKEAAKKANKTEAEIKEITKPEKDLRFTAHGITVLD